MRGIQVFRPHSAAGECRAAEESVIAAGWHVRARYRSKFFPVKHANIKILSIQIMFLLGSFVPFLLVDRIGRRRPMMLGSLGLGVSMMLISILLSFKGTSIEKQASTASVAFFFTVYNPSIAKISSKMSDR